MTNARHYQRASAKLVIAFAFLAIAVAGIAVSRQQSVGKPKATLTGQPKTTSMDSRPDEISVRQVLFHVDDDPKKWEEAIRIWEKEWNIKPSDIPDIPTPYAVPNGQVF